MSNDPPVDGSTKEVISTASQEARAIILDATEQLKNNTVDSPDPSTRLFFPNGIDLIFVKISATLTSGVGASVEVKIAGPNAKDPPDTVPQINDQQ